MKKKQTFIENVGLVLLYAFAVVWNLPKTIKRKLKKQNIHFMLPTKKAMACALAIVMTISALPLSNVVANAETQDIVLNTETNTYEIYTAKGLSDFRDMVNGGETSINAKLMADITFNDADKLESVDSWGTTPPPDSWVPISYYDYNAGITNKYAGTFDGDNHTISGLYCDISSTTASCGLFGEIDYKGNVKKVNINKSYFKNANDVGTVSGSNYGNVSGCTTSNSRVYSIGENAKAGGIIGMNANSTSKISYCINYSTTVNSDKYYAGGIVGFLYGSINNCTNKQDQSFNANGGGIAGCSGSSVLAISNCNNFGNISGSKGSVGGICANIDRGTISDCYNIGNVTLDGSTGGTRAGGIVGKSYGSVKNCHNVGNVVALTAVAGAYPIGYNEWSGSFENTYYLSDSETDTYAGTSAKTAKEFASGDVTYLLNGDQSKIAFGQTLKTDSYPVFITEENTNQIFRVTFRQYGATDDTGTKYAYATKNGSAAIPTEFANKNMYILDSQGNLTDTAFTGETAVTADIVVSYIPQPTYTVTIPATVDFGDVQRRLEKSPNRMKKVEDLTVSAKTSYLFANNKKLSVTLSSDFLLTSGENELAYEVYDEKDALLKTGSTVLDLNYTDYDTDKITNAKFYATLDQSQIRVGGKYTGTLTFTVALDDIT